MTNALFPLVREFVRNTLAHPHRHEWSIQGFGMLRTYIGPPADPKRYRLNVWHSAFAVPNVSTIHDHPWNFKSWIIAGRFTNQRYSVVINPDAPNFMRQTIRTGEGGGPIGEPESVFLLPIAPETYAAGHVYSQHYREVHESQYADGTVTVNERERVGDGEHAYVFWPVGTKWVDAQPRTATTDEVAAVTSEALRAICY